MNLSRMGEIYEDAFRGHLWHHIVVTYPNTAIEVYARALKDLCADTDHKGLLPHIINEKHRAALAFYVAFLRPFARLIFPKILRVFHRFQKSHSWTLIENVCNQRKATFHGQGATLVAIHQKQHHRGVEWAKEKILEECIAPLGIVKKAQHSSSR